MSTPKEVFGRARACVLSFDADGYADLFAETGVLEIPFAPSEMMPRRLEGREEIRRAIGLGMGRARDAGRRMLDYHNIVMHQSIDPEVLIVEFEAEGQNAAGEVYRLPYIHVLRVRDGEIVSLRDYFGAASVNLALKR
jgi:ketosteroid isomerase-like protein